MEGLTLKRLRRDCPVCGFGSKKKSKKSATSANLPSIEIGSEEKDEENFSRNFNESDSDKDEEQNALKKLPWKVSDNNDDDDESIEKNVFYDLFELEIDEHYEFDEKKARAVWKMVEQCTSRLLAIIIAYTLYGTGRETFDHFLCEELVEQTVRFWRRHNRDYGGDDYLKAVKRWEEGEQRRMKSNMEKNEESLETVTLRPDSTNSVSRVPKKNLHFKMLDALIKKDRRDTTNEEYWLLEKIKGYGNFNLQRACRAWEIVSKLDTKSQIIIGEVFYLTEREEVGIELMLELVKRMWDSLEEFGTPVDWQDAFVRENFRSSIQKY
ncbi:hypothetical protein GCK72_022365 [Caenorhabditis remanei]|uniref:Uncharacterized protein n=1 Tax=Caenorhabditis remanei TaxID=31234 RepID=A0A6A5FTJ2_CAERE|nr:hypothetical protein GCK72_022365 [Caenorhabditis remanei]KAF1745918.1 hypothetical protein GCK72_022365 [Caenorhabditis remanei]